MITIIDYGSGNINALIHAYRRLNISVVRATKASDLVGASKLILPGVGAFDHVMQSLHESGMCDTLNDLVMRHTVPILGICVGMQILAHASEEGNMKGLGWVDGFVKKMPKLNHDLLLPHMGWNDVLPVCEHSLFSGLENAARFYFLHSYYFDCDMKEAILATSDYGHRFACAVNNKNIYGVQFHPEKSHTYGVRLLKNFADL